MQIKTLYLNLKLVKGSFELSQHLNHKVALHMKKYDEMPKYGRFGYYNKVLTNDKRLDAHIDTLQAQADCILRNILRDAPAIRQQLKEASNPHWTTKAAQYKKLECVLMCSIANLCRAKVMRKWKSMEDSFYHMNTTWLAINRLVYGEDTTYINATNIAHEGNFIPMKERFYGKRQ
jgi:hypothetical protein